jgi:potassium uptake TrkH family protein
MVFNPDLQKSIYNWMNGFLSVSGLLSLALLIFISGFYFDEATVRVMEKLIDIQIALFIIQELVRVFIANSKIAYIKKRAFELVFSVLLILYLIFPQATVSGFEQVFPNLSSKDIAILYLSIIQIPILFLVGRKALKYTYLIGELKLHPAAIFMISFAFIILSGAGLLMLPKAAAIGKPSVSFVNALFTSTSAVCVTGLTVLDTAKDFSTLGQIYIMGLIQVGGLGVMTLTTLFAIYAAGGLSFQVRVMMGEFLSEDNLSDVYSTIKKVIFYTLTIEGVCAFIMYYSLGGSFVSLDIKNIYSSIFHAVSAFCNAGFSIYSENLMGALTLHNYLFTFMIMALIVLGGLGFGVLSNVTHLKPWARKQKRIRYQLTPTSKMVLITTAILIFIPGAMIYLCEPMKFLPNMGEFEKFWHSIFLSVSSRTAGFNTIQTGLISESAALVVIFLMIIGASPGSTGGGVKTTTFAIASLSFWRSIRGKERLEIFHREIPAEHIKKALMIIFTYGVLMFIGVFIMSVIESDKNALDLAFECSSALSTVGLSRDLTMRLGEGGKYFITLYMFIGRIGVFSFFISFFKPSPEAKYKLPETTIMIG